MLYDKQLFRIFFALVIFKTSDLLNDFNVTILMTEFILSKSVTFLLKIYVASTMKTQ